MFKLKYNTPLKGACHTLGTSKIQHRETETSSRPVLITRATSTYEAIDGGVKVTAKGERADSSNIDSVTTAR
jgi:hypothetical protein